MSVLIATTALSTGISGALFFAPFFLLALGLEPAQASGAGHMTELFGTGFATLNYVRQGVVDVALVRLTLVVSIPVAMDGFVLALILDASSLQVAFGVILIFLPLLMLRFSMSSAEVPMSSAGAPMASATSAGSLPVRTIQARDEREYTYVLASRRVGLALCGFGALLTVLLSAGLPEVNTTQMLVRYRMAPRVTVASSITMLSIAVFFAVGIHALGGEPVWYVVAWSWPGPRSAHAFRAWCPPRSHTAPWRSSSSASVCW